MTRLFIVVVWFCGLVFSLHITSEYLCEPMEYDLQKGESFKDYFSTLSDPMGKKIVWIVLLLEMLDEGDGTKIIPTSSMSFYFSIDIVITVLNKLLESESEMFKFKIRRVYLTQAGYGFMNDCYNANVWFVMGPNSGQEISMWSKVTTTVPMPFLTFGSTRESENLAKAKLSKEVSQYLEFMFEIHPSETFRHAAILNLLKEFKWDYISIIFSESLHDHGLDCVNMLKKNGICIANEFSISIDILLEEKLIQIATESSRNKVLVLMTDPTDSRRLLKLLKKTKLQDRFFLLFTYGSTRIKEVVSGYEDVAEGSVTVDYDYLLDGDDVSEEVLKYHVSRLTPQDTELDFFHLYWEQHFKCRLNSQLLDKSFPDREFYNVSCDLIQDASIILNDDDISSYDFIKKSMYGMAMVISKMVKEIGYECEKTEPITKAALKQCKNNCTFSDVRCLRVMLGYYLADRESGLNEYKGNKVMFAFYNYQKNEDSYSNIKYQNEMFGFQRFRRNYDKTPTENLKEDSIGNFLIDTRFVVLRNNNVSMVPSSSCSQECLPGYWKEYNGPSRSLICCWKCIPCEANSVIINNTCQQCKYFERADHTTKSCQELPVKQMGFEHDNTGLALGCISIVGVFFVLICMFIFGTNNNKHVVKSSGRDLNYLIMVAILTLFLANFSFLYKPSYAICIVRMNIPQLAIFVCFFSLLLKTIRLYRIFKTHNTQLVSPRLISPGSQIAIVLILSFFQILITGLPTFFKGLPGLEKKVSSNKLYVVLQCKKRSINQGTKFLTDSGLSLMSMLACIFLVLRLRHLPKSYNESRSYAMIAFITFLAVCFFIPFFSVMKESDNYWHEIALCVLGILIGYLVISLFVLPRLWSLWRYGDTILERPANLTQPLQPTEPNMNVDELMHDQ